MDYDNILKREDFYSTLNHKDIVKKEYLHYKIVWDEFKNKTLRNYSELYNVQDVLILADLFDNFRNNSLNLYGLDPAYYLTAFSLSWHAILKCTKIELYPITDYEMYLIIEKGIEKAFFF